MTSTISIGAAGGEEIKTLLSTSTNPPETITQFQKDHGLHPLANCMPAIRLLDILGSSRSDIYRGCLDYLTKKLLNRIEENLSQVELQQLLLRTFPFIEFPELRKIPIGILAKQEATPDIFLRKLTENREIMKQLPFHVKQRIWLVDLKELKRTLDQLAMAYITQKQQQLVLSWDMTGDFPVEPELLRKQDPTTSSIVRMTGGDQAVLFQNCIVSFREIIAHLPAAQIGYIGTLRADMLFSHRELKKYDVTYKVATILDTAKAHGLLTPSALIDVLKRIAEFCIEPKPKVEPQPVSSSMAATEAVIPLPSKKGLLDLLQQFRHIDARMIFAEPVPEEVPGYYETIKHPMDLSTMRSKVNREEYTSVEVFQQDFNTMVDNCLSYNDEKTIFYKEAKRLKKKGNDLIDAKIPELLTAATQKKRKIDKKKAKIVKQSTSPATTGITPVGKYRPELLDISLLLADTYTYHMLIKTLLKCVTECGSKRQLPSEHPMIKGLIQLLQIGDPKNITVEANVMRVAAPDQVIVQVFLPLLARMNILYGRMYQKAVVDVKQVAPMTDKCWKDVLYHSHVIRKVAQYYLIQSVRLGVVAIYKNLLEQLADCQVNLVDDAAFVQSLVSAVLSHKGNLSIHMRTITIDEFLVPKLKPGLQQDGTIARPVLHLQFARFLAESAHFPNCSISPPDLQAYAQDALSSFQEELLPLWTESPSFGPIRECYEKLFLKFPGARTELGLPSTTSSNGNNNHMDIE